MGFYLVKARVKPDMLEELYHRLMDGYIEAIEPFGETLAYALVNARIDIGNGKALWEEECYCDPPLAMERRAILDRYFMDIEASEVSKGEGWNRIRSYPRLWIEYGFR